MDLSSTSLPNVKHSWIASFASSYSFAAFLRSWAGSGISPRASNFGISSFIPASIAFIVATVRERLHIRPCAAS